MPSCQHLAQADSLRIRIKLREHAESRLLEAMAVGCPSHAPIAGRMPELLADAGLYFDPEDHVSIAEAIRKAD